MKRACLLAALFAVLLPVGCGKKGAGMFGTYKGRAGVPPHDVTITFQDDGTFESKSPAEAVKGTYKLEGRKLSVMVTEVNGKPPQVIEGKDAEAAVATLSEDASSFDLGDLQFRKLE